MNGVLDKRKGGSPLHRGETTQMSESQELILKKKLQIKTQALMMLSQELDQCRMQRDRCKLMAEEMQEDLSRRKQVADQKTVNGYRNLVELPSKANTLEEDTKIMDLLIEAREQNKCLRLQVDTLRQKYKEAQEDIKALRSRRMEEPKPLSEITPALHQREEMIEQLEKMNVKCRQLKLDLQSVLDEKQELELERDAFKCKAHRLNHELSQALSASRPVDVDALINENRYLQERLQQLLEEKELAQQSVQKYKSMLDSKRQKGVIKLGGKSSVGSVMNFKQVEQLLQQGPNIPPQKSAAALSELHSLCTALLEALNDKNLALAHQKKANKILAARMCELDRAVQSPTVKLLEGYSSADVDIRCDSTSVTSDISEERSEDKESDLQCDESFIDRDAKSKQSDESSVEQSVKSKLDDECCIQETVKSRAELDDESHVVLDVESNFKSVGYRDGTRASKFKKIDLEETLQTKLPEHLRLIVQNHLDELKAKDPVGS
ncbi:coiled-coil domain-containing protein 149 [Nasonia vitripennis]|uniref:Coiled-coil domain-containing protein 149 n=1 Tax=Nasonia vitripennis TaxID=7425 RepID=A0A7M7LMF8_NASVI|nr:coiled-coil domain-containing protein 149 [Nasonia vitripennis]